MNFERQFTVSIIGCGSRGRDAYGKLFDKFPEKWKIVSLCDISEKQLGVAAQEFHVQKENLFSDENKFFAERRSDLCVIATQDKDHARQCKKALELGYDVLLEKPISSDENELKELLSVQKKTGGKVMVCHVLRYAPVYVKMAEEIKSGRLGKIISVNAAEQICYWHFSHSYVRGNWRNSIQTSPVIMAKCCHDMDILQYFAGAKCKSVYSIGSLSFFNRNNQPEGRRIGAPSANTTIFARIARKTSILNGGKKKTALKIAGRSTWCAEIFRIRKKKSAKLIAKINTADAFLPAITTFAIISK